MSSFLSLAAFPKRWAHIVVVSTTFSGFVRNRGKSTPFIRFPCFSFLRPHSFLLCLPCLLSSLWYPPILHWPSPVSSGNLANCYFRTVIPDS
ncbi:hypothetical protein BDW72DRAFT_186266 [Aspergillus terricola var. indicus]